MVKNKEEKNNAGYEAGRGIERTERMNPANAATNRTISANEAKAANSGSNGVQQAERFEANHLIIRNIPYLQTATLHRRKQIMFSNNVLLISLICLFHITMLSVLYSYMKAALLTMILEPMMKYSSNKYILKLAKKLQAKNIIKHYGKPNIFCTMSPSSTTENYIRLDDEKIVRYITKYCTAPKDEQQQYDARWMQHVKKHCEIHMHERPQVSNNPKHSMRS